MNADHPPDENETLPEAVMGPIDVACDRFEAEWQNGQRPGILEFVDGVPPEGQRRLLLELLGLDLEYRLAAGESPELGDYTPHFPQFASQVQSVFFKVMNSFPAVRPVADRKSVV